MTALQRNTHDAHSHTALFSSRIPRKILLSSRTRPRMQVCYHSLTKPLSCSTQRRKTEKKKDWKKSRSKKRELTCVDRTFWSRMAYHYHRWATQSSCHFSKARPVLGTSPAPHRRIWSKYSFPPSFAYGQEDIRIFLWRLWLCSADW